MLPRYPGHIPRIDGFTGAPIGAIYGAQPQPEYVPGWGLADEERRHNAEAAKREAQCRRERAEAEHEAARTALVERVRTEPDPSAQVILAMAMFTGGAAPNGAVQIRSGVHLTRALPSLFPRTLHWLDPGSPAHAPWDSTAIAGHFSSRMLARGAEPDRQRVKFASRAAFGRIRYVERSVSAWSFPGGLTNSGTAIVLDNGTLQVLHDLGDGVAPQLNVVALRNMAQALCTDKHA